MATSTDVPSSEQRAPAASHPAARRRRGRPGIRRPSARTWRINGARLLVACAFLAAWQWLPSIHGASDLSVIFDRFVVSSPSDVAAKLADLVTGANNTNTIWGPLGHTVLATLIGTTVALVIGSVCGLLLSEFRVANDIFRPFIIAFNAVPRIALIPVILLIAGPGVVASLITCLTVVFFLAFFSAFEGGRNIPAETIHNARILGAGRRGIIFRVRLPYVVAWVFTGLPNAVGFGLLSVIFAEMMSGTSGIGQMILIAVNNADAPTTFAAVVVLAIVGLILVGATSLVRSRVLHWWDQ